MAARRTEAAPGAAAAAPPRTPGLVLAGLAPKPVEALGLRLGPMSMRHWLALQSIDSPLSIPGGKTSVRDVARAVALLVLPPRDAEALAADPDALDAAADAILDAAPAGAAVALTGSVTECIRLAFATCLPFKEDLPPGHAREKKVSSDGSSPSSVDSSEPTGGA